MKKLFSLGLVLGLMSVFVSPIDGFGATKTSTKKQSAIQMGTKVRTRVEATGVYKQECYDAYYSCMDQFCIVDNELGGSCNCSDDITKYENDLEQIKQTLAEAERISTEEVEKVQAGANADIIFNGTRTYDDKNKVVAVNATKDKSKNAATVWSSLYSDEEDEEEDEDLMQVSNQTGAALYTAAHDMCKKQIPDSCASDLTLLTQIYARQIVSDCKGLANSIAQKKTEANSALLAANASVRAALKESLEESNQYDRGQCMVEYKKCMMGKDACGGDWESCVMTVASENMQNNEATSVAGTKVATITRYNISASTMERLESKRFICENVLDKCVAVRDYVWEDFIRDVAPTVHLAELNIESQKRQSCLTDISTCIQKACRDDIAGKGVATMDACLARPDMARSFCKVQIEPCERMEPQIWDYVESKLAAMRVDACTAEVKECFTAEDRCGKDFQNCIGMDFDYIHDICPIDKLVVCKQTDPDFTIAKLDEMLMGLYLNIDNQALENCQNIAESKMMEFCGSTTDCNAFAADEYIGTSSIKSQKFNDVYRVSGMISFGSIKMGDAMGTVLDGGIALKPGEIGVKDYIKEITKNNNNVPDRDAIISSIQEELNNISGTINRTISLLESDQQIQYCINGRDLSQINGKGKDNNTTVARFPNLLNQYRVAIAMSALRKAQDNYNKKLNDAIADATKDASADVAQYMCQMLPAGNSVGGTANLNTPLTAPYSISYEVGAGVSNADLAKIGPEMTKYSDASMKSGSAVGDALSALVLLPSKGVTTNIPGGTKTVRSTFNRDTRTCHLCTEMVTRECKQKGVSILFIDTRRMECGEEKREETCQDIQM